MDKINFAKRRQKLVDQLEAQDAVILFASSEIIRNGDVHYPFRQNSTFYYFTGYSEPEAVAILLPGNKDAQYVLFNLPKDPIMERWVGKRVGQDGAINDYGASLAFEIDQIEEKILELLAGRERIFYEMANNPIWDRKIVEWTQKLQDKARRNAPCPAVLADLKVKSNEMRLFKDPQEIDLLRKAAQKSAQAHIYAMKNCRPQMYEYQLEALLNYELNNQGCRAFAYPTIVGGGKNACILHYVENIDPLISGDLVLIDAGGEYKNYAADITRTFPINGKFSSEQAEIYNVVLEAQQQVINLIRPGTPLNNLQETAIQVLVEGLVRLGILSGPVTDAIEQKSYQNYYMHNLSHWLGLDVHDVGAYRINDQWRTLEEGMVLTVEPGLYLSGTKNLEQKWWNIGVRIEDDVLVTANGCEVLSAAAPKSIAEIEELMAKRA